MITLRKITLENRRELFNLEVKEHQKSFVASNLSSIASCYVLATNGGCPLPYAIYYEEQMVGFVMIVYGITGYELPSVAHNNYSILRFMIDKKYQNKGYGKAAMLQVLEYIRTFPAGAAEYCWLQYEEDNHVAKEMYESLGFQDNGETSEGEPIMVLRISGFKSQGTEETK